VDHWVGYDEFGLIASRLADESCGGCVGGAGIADTVGLASGSAT
jgi:hypothetical protein